MLLFSLFPSSFFLLLFSSLFPFFFLFLLLCFLLFFLFFSSACLWLCLAQTRAGRNGTMAQADKSVAKKMRGCCQLMHCIASVFELDVFGKARLVSTNPRSFNLYSNSVINPSCTYLPTYARSLYTLHKSEAKAETADVLI